MTKPQTAFFRDSRVISFVNMSNTEARAGRRRQGGAGEFRRERREPLLGATTRESLGLVLNPFKRELHPMR